MRQAARGGVDAVLCRLKELSEAEAYGIAAEVRQSCAEAGVPCVISHWAETALRLKADGLQLGAADPPLAEMRARIGKGMVLGYSAHSVEEARRAMEQGAGYVFLGPVFPTPAKLRYGAPLGLGVVRPALELPRPVVFIGGINLATLPELVAAGGKRIAAIAALNSAPDVAAAAAALRRMLDQAPAG